MNRQAIFSVTASIALSLCACSHTFDAKDARKHPLTALAPVATPNEALTIEHLLLWPLEGRATGVAKVENGLKRTFKMTQPNGSEFSANSPVRLTDGYVLDFAWISEVSGDVDIGVGQTPCFSPTRAAQLIQAVENPVFQDAHGVDRGKSYDARRNGVWVKFRTTPQTYQCVTSIHLKDS